MVVKVHERPKGSGEWCIIARNKEAFPNEKGGRKVWKIGHNKKRVLTLVARNGKAVSSSVI